MNEITINVLNAVTKVLGETDSYLPLHEPEFSGNEWKYVKDCIDTGWVSSVGSYVDRFEHDLQDYTGANYAVATMNGTAALHLALILAGVKPGHEVIMPTLGFVATANTIAYCHAIPHFVDISEDTLGLDPVKLDEYLSEIAEFTNKGLTNKKTGNIIRAIICMHTFGHPVDLDPLMEICKRWNLMLVEDAAESLGSTYNGKHCGTFGHIAAISFNGNKTVTTGGGGALLTNDKRFAERAKHLSTTAKVTHPWLYIHDEVGFNYRMPNINAALGCAQIESLDKFIIEKRQLAGNYIKAFEKVDGVSVFTETEYAKSNYWLNTIILESPDVGMRDKILELLNSKNYMSRPVWSLLHALKPYQNMPYMDNLDIAERMEKTLINLPSSPKLMRIAA